MATAATQELVTCLMHGVWKMLSAHRFGKYDADQIRHSLHAGMLRIFSFAVRAADVRVIIGLHGDGTLIKHLSCALFVMLIHMHDIV